MIKRRRRSVRHTFEENIAAEKTRIEAELVGTPEGAKRNALVKKISQLETATHINNWLKSPGL